MNERTTPETGTALAGRDSSVLLDGLEFPKAPLWMRLWYGFKGWLRGPQCSGEHIPYAHLTDEECNNLWIGRNENRKVYYCMRRRRHFGRHEDIHGRRW